MIPLGSFSAFSAGGAAASPAGVRNAARPGAAGGVERVRTQAASPPTTTQGAPQALPAPTDKKLPRGSLLNLQV
jgi:hypothetical protein